MIPNYVIVVALIYDDRVPVESGVIIFLSYLRQEAIVCGQRLSQFLVASGHKLYE